MEVLFVWIDDFRNIRHQGLNTNAEYRFDYSLNNATITIVRNDNYIEGYFGNEVKNVTAIVGENGTGKTSILEFFRDKLGQSYDFNQKLVIVYRTDSNELRIVLHNIDKTKLKIINESNCSYLIESIRNLKVQNTPALTIEEAESTKKSPASGSAANPKSVLQTISGLKESVIIFYSNIFDYRNETSSQFVYNISTNYILGRELGKFRVHEIKSQIDFVIQSKHISNLEISLPSVVRVAFKSRPSGWLGSIYKRRTDNIENKRRSNNEILEIEGFIKLLYGKIKKANRNEKLRDTLILVLYHNFLIELSETTSESYFTAFISESIADIKDIATINEGYFLKVLSGFGYTPKEDNYPFKSRNQELITSLTNLFVFIYKRDISFKNTQNSASVHFELPISDESTLNAKVFFESYSGAFRSESVLEFDWQDMSSGEKARLAFLSRLNSLKSDTVFRKHGKNKNILLLIDEGEQYFHPQWQKEYIKFLITNIPKVIPNVSFQIILTSHSPFILSDLTRENVIYLARNRRKSKVEVIDNASKERTLAANIHTLFRDAYFMKDGLIGNYAQDKMNEVLAPLVNKSMDEKDFLPVLKFINNIGEPILRNRLTDLFNEQVQGA
ncbi:AAA family ATPase [Hymenobacter sp. HDW8]|uniref:AAA family ATPase n=1 Tax=Hymenobacter sp. HDW8 TaxID=2714932 RepID=UPI0014082457|nr:AAA family ATPase [Hymenobacter sp. HDW8]QIL78462.1 AAA family ATPase [Hymenobacter sp. HDW8]